MSPARRKPATQVRTARAARVPSRAVMLSTAIALWMLSGCRLMDYAGGASGNGAHSPHDGSADIAPDLPPDLAPDLPTKDVGANEVRQGGSGDALDADGSGGTGTGGTNGGGMNGAAGTQGSAGRSGVAGNSGAAGASGVGGSATCGPPSPDDAWDAVTPSTEFTSDMLAFAPDDIWAAGVGIRHWNGMSWQAALAPPRMGDSGKLRGSGAHDLWYAADFLGFIFHFDGVSWASLTPALPDNMIPRGIKLWSVAPNRAWTVISSQQVVVDGGLSPIQTFLFQWNGNSWSPISAPALPIGIWGANSSDVWAATESSMMHWDGSAWTLIALPSTTPSASLTISSVWGTSASDVWAVGGDGARAHAWHYDGVAWSETIVTAPAFKMVWGSCPSNFYASPGSGNTIWRFDGVTWQAVLLPSALTLGAIAGSGVDDVWLVERQFPPVPTISFHWRRGRCGDGLVQSATGSELCDLLGGSVFCTSRCQVNDNCESCRNQLCGNPCGPLGSDAERTCNLLDACLARIFFGCVFNSPSKSAAACYCSDATCSMGANGQCVAQFEDAASSHDPAEVLRQIGDRQSMVGRVSASAACMAAGGAACGRFCSM
jgi:hypothetical protein